jgi:transposase
VLQTKAKVINDALTIQILSIKGVSVVAAASFLGEVGDPLRFQNARQIARYAG